MFDCSLRSRGSHFEATAFLSHSQTKSVSARWFVQDSGARSCARVESTYFVVARSSRFRVTVWQRLPLKIACRLPRLSEQPGQLVALLLTQCAQPEMRTYDCLRRLFHDEPALRSDRGQDGAAVLRMRRTTDQVSCFQALHQRRHGRGVHLKPLTDLAQRQRAPPREGQQDQDLVSGESQTQWAQQLIQLSEQQLMYSHQRCDSAHPGYLAPLRRPLLSRLFDRVKRQTVTLNRAHVPSSSSTATIGWGTSPAITMRSTSSR